jgi:hypothetical protein
MKLVRWISDLWRRDYRIRIAVILASLLLLLVLIYPFNTTTVPQWDVRVTDDVGAPVREINVTEHWQDYPLELSGHEEGQITNQEGMGSFAARTIRASLVRRMFARITMPGDRGQRVPYGAIVVWGRKDYATTVAVYRGDELPPPEIRVQRLR